VFVPVVYFTGMEGVPAIGVSYHTGRDPSTGSLMVANRQLSVHSV
jgi:hypothetical protein